MKAKRAVAIAVLVAVAGVGVYLIVRQKLSGEEGRIRKLMAQVEKNFESQKLSKCLAVATDDYSDNIGHDTKAELEDDLRLLFQTSRSVRVKLQDVEIEVRGNEADVALTATAKAENVFLGDVSLHRVVGHTRYVVTVRKERGRWKVLRAEGLD